MAANNDFEDALMRCGFNQNTAAHIIDEGIDDADNLILASHDDIDTLARNVNRNVALQQLNVFMSFRAVKQLKGFRFWVNEC